MSVVDRAIRTGLVPFGFAATAGVAVAAAHDVVAPEVALGSVSFGTLAGLTVLELAVGRWRPRLRNLPRDGTFFVVGVVLDGLGKVAVASVALAVGAGQRGPAASLPPWLALPLGLLVADGAAYAVHRAFHAHPLLWRMHALHHRPDELYAWMSTVNGPLMVVLVRALPLAALTLGGFGPTVILTYALLDAWFGLLSHTGVDTRNPWWSAVWVTPEIHRLHHSIRPEDAGNHGLLLTLWDRIFGTFVPARPDGVAQVGVRRTGGRGLSGPA